MNEHFENFSLAETRIAGDSVNTGGESTPAIPGYELIRELGRGGMGIVYEARQIRLNRIVALKMILAGRAEQHDVERFQVEAEAIARIAHPNIVQIYEIGNHGRTPYLALEFCERGTLKQQLQESPLIPEEAALVVEQLARGIQAAHESKLIHRDLKPHNVLCTVQVDSEGVSRSVYKITDFGLAKRLDEAGQTAAGDILGTPSYMAPEQAMGNLNLIGTACDIYALGATLYECLTGIPPFRGARAVDTIYQVIHNRPVSPRTLQPGIPLDIETICLKCLEKDIERRYRTAADLAADLARFQRHEPIMARKPAILERAGKWMTRHPDWAALGVVATIAVTALVGFTVAHSYRSQLSSANRQLQTTLSEVDSARQRESRQRAALETALTEVEQVRYYNALSLAAQSIQEKQLGRAEELLDRSPFPLRQWEWHMLAGMAIVPRRTETVAGTVTGMAVISGGDYWARGTDLGVVHLQLGRTRLTRHTLTDSAVPVKALVFSQNENLLAVARGNECQIVDLSPLRSFSMVDSRPKALIRHTLSADGPITALGFSGDGLQLATVTNEAIQVWDVISGDELQRRVDHSPFENACFRDNSRTVAWSNGHALYCMTWDMSNPPIRIEVPDAKVTSLVWRPDRGWLYCVSPGEPWRAHAWDPVTQQKVDEIPKLTSPEIKWSSDGRWLVTRKLRTIELTPLAAPGNRVSLMGNQGPVAGVIIRSDSKIMQSWGSIAGTSNSEVISWNLESLPHPVELGQLANPTCITFLLDGKRIAAGGSTGEIRIWDNSGRVLSSIQAHRGRITQLAFAADGTVMASTGTDGATRLWLAGTGAEIASVPIPAADLIFQRDTAELTLIGQPTLKVDLQGQRHTDSVPEHMTCFAGSRDGARFLVYDPEWGLGIWGLDHGRELQLSSQMDCKLARFRPDGRQIAWVDLSGFLHISRLDVKSDNDLTLDQTSTVRQLAYNSTGERLAVVTDDGKVEIRAGDSGEAVVTMPLDGAAAAIAFSPQNDLAVAYADGRILLWKFNDKILRFWSPP